MSEQQRELLMAALLVGKLRKSCEGAAASIQKKKDVEACAHS